jgi:hypothetical protein
LKAEDRVITSIQKDDVYGTAARQMLMRKLVDVGVRRGTVTAGADAL